MLREHGLEIWDVWLQSIVWKAKCLTGSSLKHLSPGCAAENVEESKKSDSRMSALDSMVIDSVAVDMLVLT